MRKTVIGIAAIAVSVGLLGAGAAAAVAKAPIAPNQFFNGLVNGHSKEATILMVCPGPAGGLATRRPGSMSASPARS